MAIKTDIVAEFTAAAGVTVDGVLIKDGNVDGADVSALATASHAAVTLDTNADTLLSLSTQALGLDVQAANAVLVGPATGAAAVPTFRALVSDDVPALDHGTKLSGLADDDHTQYLLATGARTGASSQAQSFGATGIQADTIAESTSAAGVTVDGVLLKDGGATLIEPLIAQEETAASANPAAGYRKLYPYSAGGWMDRDDAGYEHALAWAAGQVAQLATPAAIAATKAGTFSDADTDADGTLAVDKTNNRVYFRAAGLWYWMPRSAIVALLDGSQAFTGQQTFDAGIKADAIAEKTAAAGVTADGVLLKDGGATLIEPLIAQEETASAANPASGYRKLYPHSAGNWLDRDDAGYEHALAWAAGQVAQIATRPAPGMWQHKAAATGRSYGPLRVECGRDTLSGGGTCAVTFQTAFTRILEIFVQDKTAAAAIYAASPATTGFTATGTASDTFCWMAIGVD